MDSLTSFPLYRWRNRGLQRVTNLPKVTQPVNGSATMWTQTVRFQSLKCYHYAVLIPPPLMEDGLEQKYVLLNTVLVISIEKKNLAKWEALGSRQQVQEYPLNTWRNQKAINQEFSKCLFSDTKKGNALKRNKKPSIPCAASAPLHSRNLSQRLSVHS